jgi:hypothetical protein
MTDAKEADGSGTIEDLFAAVVELNAEHAATISSLEAKYVFVTKVWYQLPAMRLVSFGQESSASVCNGLIYIVGPYGLTCFDPGSGVSTILAQPLFRRKNAFTFVLGVHVAVSCHPVYLICLRSEHDQASL